MAEPEERTIPVGETAAGDPYGLPVADLLTGRAFITGKSGSGKSNTASVMLEELLERGHPFLVVDVDGEYYGLKEEYELLHVGATDECDLQVGAEHAEKLAELALDQLVPIVLDVSGYLDPDAVDNLVRETASELFAREQRAQHPFLLVIEECHEYLPQQGSLGETGRVLQRVAKRGRKRGLGIAGISQRPADVDKGFITQADLLVWHRLTWDNDTNVVSRVVGSEYADRVGDLTDGAAFVQADWAEADVETVQFRRKHTFDAGAAPGLDDVERPDLKSIDEDLVDELQDISEQHDRRQDRIADLEARLDEKDERIAELEEELEDARDLQRLGEAFVDAAQSSGGSVEAAEQELLEEKNETIADLRDERDALEQRLADLEDERDELAAEADRLQTVEERIEQAERIEDQLERARDVLGVNVEHTPADDAHRAELQTARERIAELEAELERARSEDNGASDLAGLIEHDAVQAAVGVAKDNADRAGRHFDRVLAILASSEGGPLSASDIEPLMDDVGHSTVNAVLRELFDAGVLRREKDGRGYEYALDQDFLERRIEVAEQQP